MQADSFAYFALQINPDFGGKYNVVDYFVTKYAQLLV